MIEVDGRRAAALGPSAGVSERYHVSGREMSVGIVRQLIEQFGNAAQRMKTAGFDGIEVAASHGYLVAPFLAPSVNRRTDEYSGSFENRMRFLMEILSDIRCKIGSNMPVGVRISGDELASDGLTSDEVLAVCDALEAHGGVAYLDITSRASRQARAAIGMRPFEK